MKWFILGLVALGGVSIIIGSRESNDRTQSADVRAGGMLPLIFGMGCIVFALIIGFVAFLVNL